MAYMGPACEFVTSLMIVWYGERDKKIGSSR
jgi:hypothetical protein